MGFQFWAYFAKFEVSGSGFICRIRLKVARMTAACVRAAALDGAKGLGVQAVAFVARRKFHVERSSDVS